MCLHFTRIYCFLFTIIGVILIYIIFFKDEGWNNVEMVYDGKALTARIRSVSPDGTGVEEKDTKILSGIGKNTNISLIIRYGKKIQSLIFLQISFRFITKL